MENAEIIKEYQCPGCLVGEENYKCFKISKGKSISCDKHIAGTIIFPGIGKIFLGMPKGFNRLGEQKIKIEIYKTQKNQEIQWGYDKFNVPIWKHQNKKGHIFIRGYQPRLNKGFLHIILKGDFKSINAHEIDINNID